MKGVKKIKGHHTISDVIVQNKFSLYLLGTTKTAGLEHLSRHRGGVVPTALSQLQ